MIVIGDTNNYINQSIGYEQIDTVRKFRRFGLISPTSIKTPRFGIHGSLYEATEAEAPTCERLTPYDFKEVAGEEYKNTVLDLRCEEGE